ncbi:histone-lysine N-methyltransferase SETMAR [Trichonephila clavipes]|nr:histone-lysine N-methyltransferase SETMAR [Trichonephila clavipes]
MLSSRLGLCTALFQPVSCLLMGNECVHEVGGITAEKSVIRHPSMRNLRVIPSYRSSAVTIYLVVHVSVYGADTVTANYAQFWFRSFRAGIFDVKNAPRTYSPVVENIEKTTEIIQVERHVSRRSIVHGVKIDYRTVLNSLCKVGFKKMIDVWVPHE